MPAKYVRPYSKGQKNDFNDADAIAEAVQRPTMKLVATSQLGETFGSNSIALTVARFPWGCQTGD
jgi:transposase